MRAYSFHRRQTRFRNRSAPLPLPLPSGAGLAGRQGACKETGVPAPVGPRALAGREEEEFAWEGEGGSAREMNWPRERKRPGKASEAPVWMGGCVLVSRLTQPPGSSALGTRIPDPVYWRSANPPAHGAAGTPFPWLLLLSFAMCLILNLSFPPAPAQNSRPLSRGPSGVVFPLSTRRAGERGG